MRVGYRATLARGERGAPDRDDPAPSPRSPPRRAGCGGGRRLPGRRHRSPTSSSTTTSFLRASARSRVRAAFLVGADGANGVVARAAGLGRRDRSRCRARGERSLERARARRRTNAPPGSSSASFRVATAGCFRRAITRTSASAAGWRRGHGCATISTGWRVRTRRSGAVTDVRGHRLPMRALGAPAARGRALLVGDAAGLVDPLSGDGMYEAFVSARLAAEAIVAGRPEEYEAVTLGVARPPRGGVVEGEARRGPLSARVPVGAARSRCLRRGVRPPAWRPRSPERRSADRPAAAARAFAARARDLTRGVLKRHPARADAELSMDLNDVLRHAVAAGASDVHLKVGQPPVLRTDGALAPAADFGALGDAELAGRARPGHRFGSASQGALRRERRPRPCVLGPRPSALPRERIQAARSDLVRVPRDPDRDPGLRRSPSPARRRAPRAWSSAASFS